MKIILASKSPRRLELLNSVWLDVEAIWSWFDETNIYWYNWIELVEYLAKWKAKNIAQKYFDELVIWSDTFCEFNWKILWKINSKQQLYEQFKMYSWKCVNVYTAHCLIKSNVVKVSSKISKIFFKEFNEQEIQDYMNNTKWEDKAWGIMIQWLWKYLISKIEWEYDAIIWLSLSDLYDDLKHFWINLLNIQKK